MKDESNTIAGTEYIDSRCVVEFRPDDNWLGEYGFDWFRRGDYNEKRWEDSEGDVNTHYVNGKIVGRYISSENGQAFVDGIPQDPDNGHFSFESDTPEKRDYYADALVSDKDQYGFFQIINLQRNYIVPTISFLRKLTYNEKIKLKRHCYKNNLRYDLAICRDSVTVKLLIHKENIRSIEFTCENKDIELYPDIANRKLTIKYNPSNSHNDKQSSIKVRAYHDDGYTETFAGQLNIFKFVPKVLDVYFVFVGIKYQKGDQTVAVSTGAPKFKEIEDQELYLKRYLSQVQIIPCFKWLFFDIDINQNSDNLSKSLLNNIHQNVLLKYGRRHETKSLGEKVEELFNKKNENLKNSIKLFYFLDKKCYRNIEDYNNNYNRRIDKSIGGFAVDYIHTRETESELKSVLIFKDPKPSTACHELLHCLGLFHSFSNLNMLQTNPRSYTYKKGRTSNIMDYSFKDNGESNCLERFSLWKWQWKKIEGSNEVKVISKL